MATNQGLKERFIGRGAMGNVYELEGHKPPAVIKRIQNDKDHEMFKKECETLKAVHHANVVRMLYTEENGRELGIVMEYCQKGPLKKVILDRTITYSMNTVLIWGIQLFDAIDHMYQKHSLVHRDVKPDNIFVTNEYQLKIGDFGLVKVLGDGTVTGTLVGTQRYMSPPELIDNHIRDVYDQIKDPDIRDSDRNDVYSLGLVVWEIIERRTIFLNYGPEGGFNRDELVLDIGLKRVTEIESPECQSEIQEIILKCTNFQRIDRPTASQVLDFLKTYKTNRFISSLPFMPTEDENQKELMKPIGFDDRTEWVMVGSEERKYEKRFEENFWGTLMQGKLGKLNFVERDNFYKEAPNIVSRLKEETQTFKDARYVLEDILRIEKEKKNLHEKNIYEIFELFALRDFHEQLWQENQAFAILKSQEEIWISNFDNWRRCEKSVNRLKEIKREKYTTNFYFRCFISQKTGEGWIHIGRPEFALGHRRLNEFVSEDLKLRKRILGQWVDNPRTDIRSYEIENEDKKHELLHFSHYEQIHYEKTLERIIDAVKKQRKRMEMIIKLHLKYLIPIEDLEKNKIRFKSRFDGFSEYRRSRLDESSIFERSYWPDYEPDYGQIESHFEYQRSDFFPSRFLLRPFSHKNNVKFKIQSLLDESSAYRFSKFGEETKSSSNNKSYPFPHYLFQLRNPPRPICQENHSGKCQMNGFRKLKGWSDLPKELHIPVCGKIGANEVLFLKSYLDCMGSYKGQAFSSMTIYPFLFLCCQNLLDIPFLILLDHPNNYENGESIPGLDLKEKLHPIDVEVLKEYFQDSKLNERVYALIKNDRGSKVRLIDYRGNPKTEWLEFEKVPNSASHSLTNRRS